MASPTALKVGAYDLDKVYPGPRQALPVLEGDNPFGWQSAAKWQNFAA